MKRVILTAAAGVALMVGCAAEHSGSGGGGGATAQPAAKRVPYFEVPADGQTYVFGSKESAQKFLTTKQLPPMTTHYNKGMAIQIEAANADALIKEYESQHK